MSAGNWSLMKKDVGGSFSFCESHVGLSFDVDVSLLVDRAAVYGMEDASAYTLQRDWDRMLWEFTPPSLNYPAFEWRFTPTPTTSVAPFILTLGDEAHRYPEEDLDEHLTRYANSRRRYTHFPPNLDADRPMSVCLILRCANMPGVSEAAPIVVRSSNGDLLVARDGRVVHVESDEDSLHQILKFDLSNVTASDEYDILDLGYWYHHYPSNSVRYEPRVQ